MVVTVVLNNAILTNPASCGVILVVALIVYLITKEITAGNPSPIWSALHRSLKVAWLPFALVTVIVFGEQLHTLGIL